MIGEKKSLAFEALQNRKKSVREIAKALSVGEATIYRYQRERKVCLGGLKMILMVKNSYFGFLHRMLLTPLIIQIGVKCILSI